MIKVFTRPIFGPYRCQKFLLAHNFAHFLALGEYPWIFV